MTTLVLDLADPRLTDHERHVLAVIAARLDDAARVRCTEDPTPDAEAPCAPVSPD